MIGYYNYTVILTYLGLTSALCGIFASMAGNPLFGVICLLVAGFCDMFDGKIARTRKRTEEEKSFGIQIDSLCDLVCFGVLPAVVAFALGLNRWYYEIILVLFVLCGLIRLAYYNVTEISREKETNEARHAYLGLPITFSALFVPIAYVLKSVIPDAFYTPFLAVVFGALGLAYITPFTIKKPGKVKAICLVVIGAALLALIIWLSLSDNV